jgi:hypothetical protein
MTTLSTVGYGDVTPLTALGKIWSSCRLLKLFREDFHRLETANPAIAGQLRQAVHKRRADRRGAGS